LKKLLLRKKVPKVKLLKARPRRKNQSRPRKRRSHVKF